MARFINSPLSISTATFEYMNGNTLSTITLDANSFNGGGSGTTYSAGTGLSLSGNKFNHLNSITSGSVGPTSAIISSNVFAVPSLSYDATGHIINAGTTTVTVPIGNASNVAVFNASASASDVHLLNDTTLQDVYDAMLSGKACFINVSNVSTGAAGYNTIMFPVHTLYSMPFGYHITARAVWNVTSTYEQAYYIYSNSAPLASSIISSALISHNISLS